MKKRERTKSEMREKECKKYVQKGTRREDNNKENKKD